MSLHPDIQVGSEVAIRDRRPPWSMFAIHPLWRTFRVERVSPSRRAVETDDSRRWSGPALDSLLPLTDDIRRAVVHESLLCRTWARLQRLVAVAGEGPRWPERVTPEQAVRVEELLTEIETLTGVRSQGGGQ